MEGEGVKQPNPWNILQPQVNLFFHLSLVYWMKRKLKVVKRLVIQNTM